MKDLRVNDKHLTLEQLANETGLSKSALGRYESDDCKDMSPYAVTTLASFYGVSTDYLLGVSENKKHSNADIQSLHLSDESIDLLRSGKLNCRLLCEMMAHPQFRRFMTDMEIVVDRIADVRVQDMNAVLEATRREITARYAPDKDDLYLRSLELAQVQESDFFNHVLHNDLDAIVQDIQAAHRRDTTTADEPQTLTDLQQQFAKVLSFGSGEAAMIRMFCDKMAIPYEKLTSEEFNTFMKILGKSAYLKNSPSKRGKGMTVRRK